MTPFKSFKKNETVGIDWGKKAIKAVRVLTKEGSDPQLVASGIFLLPPDLDQAEEQVKAFLSENKFSGLSTSAALDDSSIKIRKIELPQMPEADLREAIKFKMRDVVEGSIDEYVVRSSSLKEEADTQVKRITMVGYAVKKASVTRMIEQLIKVGTKPDFIEPAAVSFATSIENVYPSTENWIAGIDIGVSKSLMVIMGHGKFYFSRPLPGIKYDVESENDPSFSQKLAAEIQNTLDTFAVTFHVEQIHRIFLGGGGASLPGLIDYLSTNLGIQTEKLNPFNNIIIPEDLAEGLKETSHLFGQALSLARMANKK